MDTLVALIFDDFCWFLIAFVGVMLLLMHSIS